MKVKLRQLRGIEERFAPDVAHPQQAVDTGLLVPLEIVADRVGINQPGIGNFGLLPPVAEHDHGIEPVHLAHRTGGTQFRKLGLVESLVLHGLSLPEPPTRYLPRLNRNLT
jgi:hypothetical protein